MSAFIVSDRHINTLVSWAEEKCPRVFRFAAGSEITWQQAGQILVDQNYASLNYLYSEYHLPHEFRGIRIMASQLPQAVAILKACACYDCQACETPDYAATVAARLVNGIRTMAIEKLPGFSDAPWDIPRTAPVTATSSTTAQGRAYLDPAPFPGRAGALFVLASRVFRRRTNRPGPGQTPARKVIIV